MTQSWTPPDGNPCGRPNPWQHGKHGRPYVPSHSVKDDGIKSEMVCSAQDLPNGVRTSDIVEHNEGRLHRNKRAGHGEGNNTLAKALPAPFWRKLGLNQLFTRHVCLWGHVQSQGQQCVRCAFGNEN
eukprot:CAMPEP_0171096848 /NCGR_PEP_ID=MMETSP0766_2-20121228/46090_1 /TAXON_ID=439317 /ORGANISM="Gambierdiscus australes, Strain CAWD 149" /LENGTH=126 /DNA_ID=CAMNT_0011555923 /DNA_START=317 /DNA_END=698 /DNA_ORIENTATION=-